MEEQQQISSLVIEPVQISARELGLKFRSKREIYRFLQCEVKAYLDSYTSMSIWHLRDVAFGERTLIKANEIKYISVPYYEGLKIEQMIIFA